MSDFHFGSLGHLFSMLEVSDVVEAEACDWHVINT